MDRMLRMVVSQTGYEDGCLVDRLMRMVVSWTGMECLYEHSTQIKVTLGSARMEK